MTTTPEATTTNAAALTYKHVSMGVQISYSFDRSIIDKIKNNTKGVKSEHLNLNQNLSKNVDRIILQSLTGSTVVHVMPNQAMLNTSYYDEFSKESAYEKRRDYAISKIETLLGYLDQAEARFAFAGISSAVRIVLGENVVDREALLGAAQKAFGLVGVLSEGAPCYDFSLRVGKIADDNFFSNLIVTWFQEREASLPVSTGISGPNVSGFQFNEWEMELVNEGIEIRYDYNNKRSLYNGKKSHTKDEIMNMFNQMFRQIPSALGDVIRKINESY